MKHLMKAAVFILLLLATVSALGYFFWYKTKSGHEIKHTAVVKRHSLDAAAAIRLKQKATSFKIYNKDTDYNSSYCFLIDMKIPSGKNRFFVYNLEKDSIEASGLVTHGSGSDKGTGQLYFSNTPNSNCTSLGKYRIGGSYNGKFGLAFKLYGLDQTNSKAFDRFVVLHAHSCVPENEVSLSPICESWGCPTVSPTYLTTLKKYIDAADKPIILWIYY
jgi:hypothetical protein